MLPAPRSRRARASALAVALAAPALVAAATPAFAAGESTTAVLTAPATGSATTFTWSYVFNQGGGHGLSNIAIGFCSAGILADVVSAGPSGDIYTSGNVPGGHTGFGAGVKFGVTAPAGTLTVTFAHPHTISAGGLRVQSHSGDGQTGDATTTAAGPGGCASDQVVTTPVVTEDPGGSHSAEGDPNADSSSSGGTVEPTLLIHSDPSPINPAPSPTPAVTPDPKPVVNPPAETVVLGETLERPVIAPTASTGDPVAPAVVATELANTGFDHMVGLLRLGAGLLGAGLLILIAAGLRRRRSTSASSAG